MGEEWRDCVVTLIDLVGVKALAKSGEASKLMREFHRLVTDEKSAIPAIENAYLFNDSALLLSYVDGGSASFESAIRDAYKLKRRVDKLTNSYAIAVKGQAFPPVKSGAEAAKVSGVTFIRTSSWAMANCFKIEETIKKIKKPWALDTWIITKIRTDRPCSRKVALPLLPSNQRRNGHLFDGYLWAD